MKVETFLSKNEVDKLIDDIKNKIDFDEKDNSVELKFTEEKSYIQKIRKIKEHILGDIYETIIVKSCILKEQKLIRRRFF